MRAHKICPLHDKCEQVGEEVIAKKMYEDIDYDMEQSGFFPKLREKITYLDDVADTDAEVLHDFADYIVWMERSKKEISFNLTKDEY